ncbi:MAG: tetratricopeptide repeat protein [Spirochaetales bacterium]|nr:tetratricopeptide repeat protein [Spirochaetales bacterium]
MATTVFERQLEEIRQAGKNRDYERAAALCTDLLSRSDQYPEALLYLGRSYHALRRLDRAVYVFQFYLKRKPDSPVGNFFLGRSYAALGLYKRSDASLRRALESDPAFAPALSFLGLVSLKLKRPEEAIAFFERALRTEPGNRRIRSGYLNALLVQGIRLFFGKDLEGAARVFEFLAGENREHLLPRLYLAVIAREMGNYPAALGYYDEASRISPDDPVFHLHKADILISLGRDEESRSELKKAHMAGKEDMAAARDPKRLLKMIAVTHYRNKRYREAIYFGKKVLKENYRDIDMHLLLAECYRHFDDLTKAKNHYLRAFEADRTEPAIFSRLVAALWEAGDFAELLSVSRRWLGRLPADPLASYFEALALSEVDGAAPELIPLLQEQIRSRGPDPELMFSLGRAYVEGGRFDLAESWLERTVKLIDDHEDALLLLDEVYEELGKPADQIRVLKAFCNLRPEENELLKKCVRLLLQEARFDEAGAGLERLLTREPGNRSLRKALGQVYIKGKKYADAFIIWKELLSREPTSTHYLRQLIFCLVKMRKLEMAIKILDKASRYMKNDISLLLPLGVLYARSREFEKANETFRRVIGLNARDWRAYHNLAMLARRTGNKALAENFLERARQYRPPSRGPGKKKGNHPSTSSGQAPHKDKNG